MSKGLAFGSLYGNQLKLQLASWLQNTRDGVFISTTGLGIVRRDIEIRPQKVRPSDAIIVSGDLGRHGIAVLSVREGLAFIDYCQKHQATGGRGLGIIRIGPSSTVTFSALGC